MDNIIEKKTLTLETVYLIKDGFQNDTTLKDAFFYIFLFIITLVLLANCSSKQWYDKNVSTQ